MYRHIVPSASSELQRQVSQDIVS